MLGSEAMLHVVELNVVYWLAVSLLIGFVAGVVMGKNLRQRRRPSFGEAPAGARGRNPCELYVGNLSYETTDEGLMNLVSKYGEVLSARVIVNKVTGASKGYGFVKMEGNEAVRAAIGDLDGKTIDGRRLSVSEAKTRPRSGRRER